MKRIKTVVCSVYNAERFDQDINNLLAEGWQLVKREMKSITGYPSEAFNIPHEAILYAELEQKASYPEEVTL